MSHSVFGPPLAECAICSLREGCEQRKFVTSHVGKNYRPGGLMLVSEFPAKIDVQQGRPLTGRVGQLLDALLESAGIDPESTWKTSVLLGMPKSTKPKDLKEHRTDIYACLPRLDAEITTAQPRVIVALGQLALEAFTGHAETKQRLLDNPCDRCNPETRKIGPVIQCFNGACKHTVDVPKFTRVDEVTGEVGVDKAALDAWRDDFLARNPNCLMCDTSWKRAKPKMIACPECGGKKKRVGEETLFRVDRVLTGREGVVGAVFHAADLPGNLTELGVTYMIPTYSPGLLILPTRDGAKAGKFLVGGQFAARAAVDHLKKAHQLLTREARFHVDVLSTANVSDRTAAQMLVDYTREPGDFTVDIETNSKKGPWGVTRIVCIGIHRIGREDGLVVDTRRIGDKWYPGNPVYDALMAFLESKAHGKVFHNGPYDLVVMLRMWGVEVEGVIGDTLAAHNACYPDEEHGLGFCAHELTDAPAWKGGEAKTESEWEAQAELSGYRTFDDLALYNARDLVATAGVWTALAGHGTAPGRLDVEGVRSAFHVDMQMYPIGIEMEVAGLPLSQDALDKVDREQSAELATLLAQMREQIGEPDFIPTPKSLVWALHAEDGPLRLPVYATTDKTQQPKLDQETLKLYRKEPFVDTLLKYKKIEYNLSHFVRSEELRTASDGRLHPVWKVWGAKTGRWTSNPNCFSGGTEVLTERGWVRLDAVHPEDGLRIAQYTPETGKIDFVAPTQWIKKPYEGELLRIETTATTLEVTPDHRCLLRHRKTGEHRVFAAQDYPEDWEQIHAGVASDVGTVRLDPWVVKFLVALQADGWHVTTRKDWSQRWSFRFDKVRKAKRLRRILTKLPFTWKESVNDPDGRARMHFDVDLTYADTLRIRPWLTLAGKTWTSAWLTEADQRTRNVFVSELHFWDGLSTRGAVTSGMYASSVRPNADLVQAVVAISGHRARLRPYRAHANAATNWQIDGVARDYSLTTNREVSRIPASDGHVYCVSVPSSYVLVRTEQNVCVTGQCQNWPLWMRSVFVAPEGRAFVGADQAQLEMRIMASLSGDEQLIHRCATADESDKLNPECDPHSYVASLVFGASFTMLDRKDPAHKKTAPGEPPCKCQKCQRATLRDIVKRVVYGLNYGAGAQTVLDAIYNGGYDGAPLTVAFIERVTGIYFRTFPKVPLWRNEIVRVAEETREIRSPLYKRHRIFPLGGMEPSVLYNYPIQSGGADIMAHGLMRLRPRLRQVDPTAMFIAQIHDAIYIECDEKRAQDVAEVVTQSMSFEMSLAPGAPPMPYVASAAIGPNLAAVK